MSFSKLIYFAFIDLGSLFHGDATAAVAVAGLRTLAPVSKRNQAAQSMYQHNEDDVDAAASVDVVYL